MFELSAYIHASSLNILIIDGGVFLFKLFTSMGVSVGFRRIVKPWAITGQDDQLEWVVIVSRCRRSSLAASLLSPRVHAVLCAICSAHSRSPGGPAPSRRGPPRLARAARPRRPKRDGGLPAAAAGRRGAAAARVRLAAGGAPAACGTGGLSWKAGCRQNADAYQEGGTWGAILDKKA